MDIKRFQEMVANNEWFRPAVYLMAGILLLMLIYFVIERPYQEKARVMSGEVEKTVKRLERYRDFNSFSSQMNDQKNRIMSISGNADLVYRANPDDLGEITKMCNASGVNPDRITSTRNEKGQIWVVSFSANFAQICNCLHNIETSYRIDNLSITRAARGQMHMVEMSISAVGPDENGADAAAQQNAAGQEMFDLYDKIGSIVERIEKKVNERMLGSDGLMRDLFAENAQPVEQKVVPIMVPKDDGGKPNVQLEAISWDPETPVAIIGGRALREGDTAQDVRVVKIHEKSVVIEWHSRQVTLNLK